MSIAIHDPGQDQPINELWAYLAVDKDGNEGICSQIIGGVAFALVFGYEHTAAKLEPLAHEMSRTGGKRIRLVKFTHREVIKEM